MRWRKAGAHFAVLVSLAVAAGGCTKTGNQSGTPEAAVENYVKTAFAAKSMEDGKKLLEMSTGDAKEWLASMSEETFRKQFLENKMVLQSLTTKDVQREKNGDVSLVYELAFRDGSADGKPTSQAVYTNKKIAYLTKVGDEWKIKATKNIKSYIERKDALEIPPNPPGEKAPEGVKP